MGWTDLFKSKSSKLKPDGALRWFGKLSTCRDYFNSTLDQEWAAEFNDWVMKGYEQYHARMASSSTLSVIAREEAGAGQKVRHLSPAACILRLPRSGMTAIASIQDYGGDSFGRPFPLCFYVGIPTIQWPGPTAETVGPALHLLDRLLKLRDDVVRFERTPSRFENVFGGREFSVDDLNGEAQDGAWRKQIDEINIDTWFSGIATGLATPDWPVWHGLLERWGNAIAAMDPEAFEATLVFPLAGNVSTSAQICGWLSWLSSRLDLSKRAVSLFWTAEPDGGPSRLSIVARELIEDDFLLITPISQRLTYLDSACALRPAKEEGAPESANLPERFGQLVTAGIAQQKG